MRFRLDSQSSLSGHASIGRTGRAGSQSGAEEPLGEESRAMKVTDERKMRQSIKVIPLLRRSIVYVLYMALKGEGGSAEGMTGING